MALNIGSPRIQVFIPGTQQPASGYKIFTKYGSLSVSPGNPIATYPTIADAINLTNPNSNPVILDSNGMANIVVTGSTKLILTDENGDVNSPIWSFDNLGITSTNVYDSNGNLLEEFEAVNNAQNWIKIINATSGNGPIIASAGNDTDVDLNVDTEGSGDINLNANTNITGNQTVTGNATISGTLTVSNLPANIIPPGASMDFYLTSAPTGWLVCDGSAVSRTTYAALFAAIGTTFGSGDGTTTFNIPNCQRRTKVGSGGSGTGTLGNTVGSTGGAETHTLQTTEIPSHTHTYSQASSGAQFTTGGVNALTNAAGNPGQTSGSTGGGGSHNNMQPSIVVLSCIKT